MAIFTILLVIVLGILGASSFIIKQKPEAKELIDKLAPAQGWIGIVGAVIGLINLIYVLLNIGILFKVVFLLGLLALMTSLVMLVLGLLLGIGVLKTFIKAEGPMNKLDELLAKVSPYQVTLGFSAIGLGIIYLIIYFIY